MKHLLENALTVEGEPPPRVVAVMRAALVDAGKVDLDDPTQRRLFVHGPLVKAVARLMGEYAAERVIDHYELTFGLIEEADYEEGLEGAVIIVSPKFVLRDRLENLLDVEGFAVHSGADVREALDLIRSVDTAVVLLDETTPDPLGEGPYHALLDDLGESAPPIVLLIGDDDRPRPRCPSLNRNLDPMAVVELVHQITQEEATRPSDAGPEPEPQPAPAAKPCPTPRPTVASPYAALVYEALELVAAPDVRDAILANALSLAGLDGVPADRTAFAEFVNVSLHEVIASRLGEEAADAVILDLQSTSGIHQRAAFQAGKRPSSIPAPEAKELESEVEEQTSRPGLLPDEDEDAIPADWAEPSTPEDEASHVRTRPVRVILADDDETLLGMLERTLEAAGFDVSCAANGRDALSMCLRDEPHVLVADMHMPVLNGRDVAQLLKRMRHDRAPATILLTADPTVPRSIPDVAEVLGKPIRAKALVDAIERVAGPGAADAAM